MDPTNVCKATNPKRKQGRGFAWEHREVLALLDIWGKSNIQKQLNTNHRNMETYQFVARHLNTLGFARNGLECRNKCKALKAEYRRVLKHNQQSGNDRITCPYFEEMDRFLQLGKKIFPKRVMKSLPMEMRSSRLESGNGTSVQDQHRTPLEQVLPSPEEPGNRTSTGEEEVVLDLYLIPKGEEHDMPTFTSTKEHSQEPQHYSSGEDTQLEGKEHLDEDGVQPVPAEGIHTHRLEGMLEEGNDAVQGDVSPRARAPQGNVDCPRPIISTAPSDTLREGRPRREDNIISAITDHYRREGQLFRRQHLLASNRQNRRMEQILLQMSESDTADARACQQERGQLLQQMKSFSEHARQLVEINKAQLALEESRQREEREKREQQMELERQTLALEERKLELAERKMGIAGKARQPCKLTSRNVPASIVGSGSLLAPKRKRLGVRQEGQFAAPETESN